MVNLRGLYDVLINMGLVVTYVNESCLAPDYTMSRALCMDANLTNYDVGNDVKRTEDHFPYFADWTARTLDIV